MSYPTLSFRQYKSEYSLYGLSEDYFVDTKDFGCSESEFEKWLKLQRMFIKRYTEQTLKSLEKICLPEKKWGFFISNFERFKKVSYLVNQYPNGYIETVGDDGQVACFLPEPSSRARFRLSFYRDHGPTYHELYATRMEALEWLARRGFKYQEGALEALVGTEVWDRGEIVRGWLEKGIHPMDGLKQDQHMPDVQRLFAEDIANLKIGMEA